MMSEIRNSDAKKELKRWEKPTIKDIKLADDELTPEHWGAMFVGDDQATDRDGYLLKQYPRKRTLLAIIAILILGALGTWALGVMGAINAAPATTSAAKETGSID